MGQPPLDPFGSKVRTKSHASWAIQRAFMGERRKRFWLRGLQTHAGLNARRQSKDEDRAGTLRYQCAEICCPVVDPLRTYAPAGTLRSGENGNEQSLGW